MTYKYDFKKSFWLLLSRRRANGIGNISGEATTGIRWEMILKLGMSRRERETRID